MGSAQRRQRPSSLIAELASVAGRQGGGEVVRYGVRSHQFVQFLSGISAGELDFSRDGKRAACVSYPDNALWRSRVDSSEPLQLTNALRQGHSISVPLGKC
jgi:hypothetical protein